MLMFCSGSLVCSYPIHLTMLSQILNDPNLAHFMNALCLVRRDTPALVLRLIRLPPPLLLKAVEAHHHTRQRRTCARSNTTETIKIAVNGTIVFCLNPDDIPKSLCLCSDPALARLVMILLHETRFVSADVFASLSP